MRLYDTIIIGMLDIILTLIYQYYLLFIYNIDNRYINSLQ